MHRSYQEHADFKSKQLTITDRDEIHHLKNVLRLKQGDEFKIFNGKHQEAVVVIDFIDDISVKVIVKEIKESLGKQVSIILACAVPKKAKFELIIEKCTELGVDEIIPLKTKRTEVVFAAEKTDAKQQRFSKVAINAAKQCKRLDIPKIHPMTSLGDVLKAMSPDSKAVIPCLVDKPQHIKDVLLGFKGAKRVYVFIGPEGDFTPDEIQAAIKAKCVPVSLGNTVLKVDTAAMTTVALCSFLLYN